MVAMAVSVTSIFINSLSDRPSLFVNAVLSVGRRSGEALQLEAESQASLRRQDVLH